MTELQEQTIKNTKSALKKLLAARGKIEGNFYFVQKGEVVCLAVTLRRRDPRGRRVLGLGKRLRAELKGCKWRTGKVFANGRIPTFELGELGKAPRRMVHLGLRMALGKTDELSFLRKAVVVVARGLEEVDDELDLSTDERTRLDREARADASLDSDEEARLEATIQRDLLLARDEMVDMQTILEDQEAIVAANQLLNELIGPDHDRDREELLGELVELMRARPLDEAKVALKRREIAEAFDIGPAIFARIGSSASVTVQHLLQGSNDAAIKMLSDRLEEAQAEIVSIHAEVTNASEVARAAMAPDRLIRLGELKETVVSLTQQLTHHRG